MAAYTVERIESNASRSWLDGFVAPLPVSADRLPDCIQQIPPDVLMALSSTFQRSLEPRALLETLWRHLDEAVRLTGLHWESGGFALRVGEQASRTLQFNLDICGEPIGKLRLYTDQEADAAQMRALEAWVALATFPLRNATLYQEMVQTAHRDPLTALGNRAAWERDTHKELGRFRRYGVRFSLMLLDMCQFKAINDTWGHDVGDAALLHVARGLNGVLRDTDLAYRIGGDEFVALLPNTGLHSARNVVPRLRHWLEVNPLLLVSGEQVTLRAHVGCAEVQPGDGAAQLYKRADEAMYADKRASRKARAW